MECYMYLRTNLGI